MPAFFNISSIISLCPKVGGLNLPKVKNAVFIYTYQIKFWNARSLRSELFKVDEPKKELEDKYYIRDSYYNNRSLSNVVHFQHDGLGFGDYSIKYEYIITFTKISDGNVLLMKTLSRLDDENKINIADKISNLLLYFNSYQDMVSFEMRMLNYKDMNTFDKSLARKL